MVRGFVAVGFVSPPPPYFLLLCELRKICEKNTVRKNI